MRNFSIIGIISNSPIEDLSINKRENSNYIDSQRGSGLTTCINPIAVQPPFTAKSLSSIENIAKPGDIPYVLQFSPNLLGGIFFSILRSHLSKRLDNQIDTLKQKLSSSIYTDYENYPLKFELALLYLKKEENKTFETQAKEFFELAKLIETDNPYEHYPHLESSKLFMLMTLVTQKNIDNKEFNERVKEIIEVINNKKYDVAILKESFDYYKSLSHLINILEKKQDHRVEIFKDHQNIFIELNSPNCIQRIWIHSLESSHFLNLNKKNKKLVGKIIDTPLLTDVPFEFNE